MDSLAYVPSESTRENGMIVDPSVTGSCAAVRK